MTVENTIVTKSKDFAIRCVNAYKFLSDRQHEYVMSRQLLKSGTSIGANVKEAIRGQTKPDFGANWIELLGETGYLDAKMTESLLADCVELLRLLTSIVKTTFADNK